ncbi:MAG: LysR family transcriptional regulator [Pseudomonadota bacterium]
MTEALPPLSWLRAFEAAARHLSFTAAAGELSITQSAVSQHIRNLEGFLGRPLFERLPRALRLTEDGTNYLPTVRATLETLAAGTRSFRGAAPLRTITLQCNLGFAALRLAPLLPLFLADHPWVVVNLVTPVWDPDRWAPGADVEIRFGRLAEPPPGAERLTRETSFPVCAPGVRQDGALPELPLLDCAGVLGNWPRWLKSQGLPPPQRPVTLCSSFVVSLGAAMGGHGVAMAHDSVAADALASGRLVRAHPAAVDTPECYFLRGPAEHLATRASEALMSWLRARFASDVPAAGDRTPQSGVDGAGANR